MTMKVVIIFHRELERRLVSDEVEWSAEPTEGQLFWSFISSLYVFMPTTTVVSAAWFRLELRM